MIESEKNGITTFGIVTLNNNNLYDYKRKMGLLSIESTGNWTKKGNYIYLKSKYENLNIRSINMDSSKNNINENIYLNVSLMDGSIQYGFPLLNTILNKDTTLVAVNQGSVCLKKTNDIYRVQIIQPHGNGIMMSSKSSFIEVPNKDTVNIVYDYVPTPSLYRFFDDEKFKLNKIRRLLKK